MSISSGGSFKPNRAELNELTSDTILLEPITASERINLLEDDTDKQVKALNAPLFKRLEAELKQEGVCEQETHIDIIGSINVQNKYIHSVAAQLFLEGNFTFLSIQEPRASHEHTQESWNAYKKSELNSARITSHETHHQVILYDTWKWGGKLVSKFQSHLNGRIIDLAFQFGEKQHLGIISVYAIAKGGSSAATEAERRKVLRESMVMRVQKIAKAWRKKFPNIHIVIMGDMQETVSETDRDNLGKYRSSFSPSEGIVAAFQDSHNSIVREHNSKDTYLTRFGNKGARGIDHILIPFNSRSQRVFCEAKIDPQGLGGKYFSSDHKLIQCSFMRKDINNIESHENDIMKYAFKRISDIKMKREDNQQFHLKFDNSQFKGSRKFKEHAELYETIQGIAGDNGESTKYHLPKIEKRIDNLFQSLWESGNQQGAIGKNNLLVDIDELQAAELAHIFNSFDYGIKDSMTFIGLTKNNDCLQKNVLVRKTIRLKQNFKSFSNLPIATKIRYLRCDVQLKQRRLKNFIKKIEEHSLKVKEGRCLWQWESKTMLPGWNNVINADRVQHKASTILKDYLVELDEREKNIEAIHSNRNSTAAGGGKPDESHKHLEKGNFFATYRRRQLNLSIIGFSSLTASKFLTLQLIWISSSESKLMLRNGETPY